MIEQEPESYVDRIKRFKGVLVHKSTGKLWYKGSKSKERTKTMKILNVTTRAKNSFKYTDAHKFYPLYVQVGDSLVNAEGENFKIRFIGKTISCYKTKPNIILIVNGP